jgi:anti-sigma factor RsiW
MEPNRLEISRPVPAHPSGELLENYALGRLSEPELGRVETHLFVCDSCQDLLVETDQYVAAMKAALAEPASEAVSWPAQWAASTRRLFASFRVPQPMPVYCAALAALSLVAMLSQSYAPSLTARESEITLQSMRGVSEAAQAHGPADTRLSSPW